MTRDIRFGWPMATNRINSLPSANRNGRPHHGIDFRASSGTPVYAIADGTIQATGTMNGYGRYIDVCLDPMKDGSQVYQRVAHLSSVAPGITTGTRVVQGQLIGYTGDSGVGSGPHLHMELLNRPNPDRGALGIQHRVDPTTIYGNINVGETYYGNSAH